MYFIFFHEILHTDAKWQYLKCDGAWFSKKCRKYAGKTDFLAFSRDIIISFIRFFAQRCVLAMLITWPSPIFEKIFFSGRKCRKYAGNRRFCRFSLDFFLIFRCFFTQTLSTTNVHHQAWLNCQYNWFLLPKLSKNLWNSRFSPEKWHFLNFSSCT